MRTSARQAVLVLGMHRSGTSAVAGTISALGAALPRKTLMGSHECNERGLFEAFAIAAAHDQLLAAARSHWHDWREFDLGRLGFAAIEQQRDNLKAILVEEFAEEPFIVLKDPRICRFVPFTTSILAELNIRPIAVLPVRNPVEVAYSLQQRNQFALSKSALLWLRHVLDAEFFSRRMPRCFISYEKFIVDWRQDIDLVAARTGVVWPNRSAEAEKWIDDFLTADLHHQRHSFLAAEDSDQISPMVGETYHLLMKLAYDGETSETLAGLNRIRRQFNDGCKIFGPAIAAEELAAADAVLMAERDSVLAAHNYLVEKHDQLRRLYDDAMVQREAAVRETP